MEFLLDFLPIIIYILLIVLLSVGICLLIKAVKVVDKLEIILKDVEDKISSLNTFFNVINWTTDKINIISERIVDSVLSVFKKLKKGKEDVNE